MKKGLMLVTVLAVVTLLVAGCALTGAAPLNGGQTTNSPGLTAGAGFGGVEVRVTDAPKYGVESVVVNFSQVSVHKAGDEAGDEGGWIDIPVEDGSFDLVELGKEGVEALLTQDDYVPAGKYTQIRVIINEEDHPVTVTYADPDNLDEDGDPTLTTVDAKLPSGELKFVHPFDVVDSTTTIIILDFIVEDSVVFTGAAGKDGNVKVILKPVVKLSVSEKGKPAELEATLASGTEAVAEWSTAYYKTAPNSVHLKTTGTVGTGKEARIAVTLPANTTLGQITGISWWTRLVTGYVPHVDIVLDMDGNGVRDHILTVEGAYQNGDLTTGWPTGTWFQTFTGASGTYPSWSGLAGSPNVGKVDDTTAVWLSPAPSPPGPPDQASIAKFSSYKAGLYGVSSSTKVLALEIEVDNWVVQSEAIVDLAMVTIGGTSYIIIP